MMKFGGHKQAAGLTIETGAHPRAARARQRLRRRLPGAGRSAAAALDRRRARRSARSPSRWRPSWRRLAPFGAGNPNPVFRASRVEIVDGPRRVKERHLKMAFRQDGRVMRGIAWRASEREAFVTEHRGAIDLAFSLEQDTWNGERYLQLSVADFKAPENS